MLARIRIYPQCLSSIRENQLLVLRSISRFLGNCSLPSVEFALLNLLKDVDCNTEDENNENPESHNITNFLKTFRRAWEYFRVNSDIIDLDDVIKGLVNATELTEIKMNVDELTDSGLTYLTLASTSDNCPKLTYLSILTESPLRVTEEYNSIW